MAVLNAPPKPPIYLPMKSSNLRFLACTILLAVSISGFAADTRGGDLNRHAKAPNIAVQEAASLLNSWRGDGAVLRDAKQKLDRALAADPSNAQAYREYARYYIMLEAPRWFEDADQALHKALSLSPGYAEAYVLQGHLYYLDGRLEAAEQALKNAERLGTNDPWLQLNWADVLFAKEQYADAAQRCKTVLNSNTKNSKALVTAYDCAIKYHIHVGELAKADEMHRKLIELEPTTAWLRGNYGAFLLCARDNPAEAMSRFKEALSIMNYGMARSGLAASIHRFRAAQLGMGNRANADELQAEASALSPGSPLEVVKRFCGSGPAVDSMMKFERKKPIVLRSL